MLIKILHSELQSLADLYTQLHAFHHFDTVVRDVICCMIRAELRYEPHQREGLDMTSISVTAVAEIQ